MMGGFTCSAAVATCRLLLFLVVATSRGATRVAAGVAAGDVGSSTPTAPRPNPTPHGYYEALRHDPSTISRGRSGNVDLVTDPDGNDLALCHLANFLCFSRSQFECDPDRANEIYTELATILLAIQHFNSGDGSIVRALEGINTRCPIRFTAEFEDSGCSAVQTVTSLTKMIADRSTNRPPPTEEGAAADAADVYIGLPLPPRPCSVVGPRFSSVTKPSSVVSSVYGLSQMSYTATSPDLSNKFQYPLFSRIVPSDASRNKAVVRFLSAYCGAEHVVMVFVNDAYGQGNQKAFQSEALAVGMKVTSFAIEYYDDDSGYDEVVANIKANGARYIFTVMLGEEPIEKMLLAAVRQGIAGAGTGYVWALNLAEWYDGLSVPKDSLLAVGFDGVAVIPEFGGKPDTEAYERYLDAFYSFGPEDVEYFNSVMPDIHGRPGTECYEAQADHFSAGKDGEAFMGNIDPFSYDTIVAMGIGACNALSEKDGVGFTGEEHTNAIVQNESFDGVTGVVRLDPEIESRDPLSFTYVVHNVVAEPDGNNPANVVLTMHESVILKPNEEGTDWGLVEERAFSFPGQTTVAPDDLPHISVDMNYIGNLRIIGYVFFGIIALLSLGFASWTWKSRNLRVVRASQPLFLILVCLGTLILGSAIVPLSMDDQYFSQNACNIACMATPWLASVGFVTAFSALFSKTWRINQVISSSKSCRRIKVTERDVMKPFALLMTANVAVLSIWTALSPLEFQRSPDAWTDKWGRTLSTHGSCVATTDMRGGALPYVIVLAAINLCAVLLANVQAYRARNIHTDYSESRYIAMVNGSLLQAWLTGVPLLVLVRNNPPALFVVSAFILFLTSLAILFLIFIPKFDFLRKKALHERRSSAGRTRITEKSRKELEALASDSATSTTTMRKKRLERSSTSGTLGLRAKMYFSARGLSLTPSVLSSTDRQGHNESGASKRKSATSGLNEESDGLQVLVSAMDSFPEEGDSAHVNAGLGMSIAENPLGMDGLLGDDAASSEQRDTSPMNEEDV